MFYVYVLKSETEKYYIGYTNDLKRRLKEHNAGFNTSTRGNIWHVHYYEAYADESAARLREWKLKHHSKVRELLMKRIKGKS